jgi:cysteine synthase
MRIDLKVYKESLQNAIRRASEKNIIIPTFGELQNPETIPEWIKSQLKNTGLWEVNSLNLFRASWKNDPVSSGGGFGGVNYMEIPSALSGVKARIFALVGKWFPTGAHKVGAAFGCLVPRLVTGQFDPVSQKAVWPSTGNYCRGGAYNSALLGCESIAILPEEMSKERFEWLRNIAGEVIATPGCESNVKEIYDKCWELRQTRDDIVIFNQFEEFGNYLWHYHITGKAMEEVLREHLANGSRFAGVVSATGSAGTIACGDYLKEQFPHSTASAGTVSRASAINTCPGSTMSETPIWLLRWMIIIV